MAGGGSSVTSAAGGPPIFCSDPGGAKRLKMCGRHSEFSLGFSRFTTRVWVFNFNQRLANDRDRLFGPLINVIAQMVYNNSNGNNFFDISSRCLYPHLYTVRRV